MQTQLLGYRLVHDSRIPRTILYDVIDTLSLEANRLDEKMPSSANMSESKSVITLAKEFPEYKGLYEVKKNRIFKKKSCDEEYTEIYAFLQKFLPLVASEIKIKWNALLQLGIKHEKESLPFFRQRYIREYIYEMNTKLSIPQQKR